jgi:molecular chaperone HtpG
MTTVEKQTLDFQAQAKTLFNLMTHSVYSNPEIFLRELISNSLDSFDRLRFDSRSNESLYEADTDFKIRVEVDQTARTITIVDNARGMSKQEVIDNLGTIAKSGTRDFLSSLSEDQLKEAKSIGQFGIGFYSAFVVAEKVVVETRAAGLPASEGVRWSSSGDGTYTVETIEKKQRGTQIVLHLKQADEKIKLFLESWRLQEIIRKYSDFTAVPIQMKKTDKDQDVWETINHAQALWELPKNKIQEEQYRSFYKHISHDFQDPLIWIHNKIEGKQEYTTLLYIPAQAPFDLWNPEKPRGLKLYVNRVFIMDDVEAFLPRYLRFIKGIIDSKDLPLNISREILQSNQLTDTIRAANTKRILDLLSDLAKTQTEKYQKFWNEFGKVIKEGVIEDFSNRENIAKLLRFSTTHTDLPEQTVGLVDYCARMQAQQKKIYYITAESFVSACHSPHLEIFRKKNIEVLLLSDRVDAWLVSHLTEFDGKPLQSVTNDDDISSISDEADVPEESTEQYKGLLEQIKNSLGDRVKDVRLSQRLTTSPACIVSEQNAMSGHLQRLMQAAGQSIPESKPILELNPKHVLIQNLEREQDDTRLEKWAVMLLEQSILAEGGQLEDLAGFVKRLNDLLVDAIA